MDYKRFCDLIEAGEKDCVDFKIECNAFQRDQKANAELIKDIIAMANNGNRASYLIIGVSDDRQNFKTVDNEKLTDDNLQRLCRDNIFPSPSVKLKKVKYSSKKVDIKHKDKQFITIQVGPQARQCFRFANDFISYNEKYCFRKNEVWIRRGATSDLASPEEIKRLIEGKAPIAVEPPENNIDYTRINKMDYYRIVLTDLEQIIKPYGGKIIYNNSKIPTLEDKSTFIFGPKPKIKINVNGQNLILELRIMPRSTSTQTIHSLNYEETLHHGILLLLLGNITSSSLQSLSIKLKESWGYFFANRYSKLGKIKRNLPKNIKAQVESLDTFSIVAGNIKSTHKLQQTFAKIIETMTQKDDIKETINKSYTTINKTLKLWSKDSCPIMTNKSGEWGNNLIKGEVWNPEKYGHNTVMQEVPEFCCEIERFLDELRF